MSPGEGGGRCSILLLAKKQMECGVVKQPCDQAESYSRPKESSASKSGLECC